MSLLGLCDVKDAEAMQVRLTEQFCEKWDDRGNFNRHRDMKE